MSRKMLTLVVLASGAVSLLFPSVARASAVGGVQVSGIATTDEVFARPLASGGGCTDSSGAASCISYSGRNQAILADFYVTSWSGVDSVGTAVVYIVDNGNSHYMYSVPTDHIGHYPVAQLGVGATGTASTIVNFYNRSGGYLFSVYSPIQYYR